MVKTLAWPGGGTWAIGGLRLGPEQLAEALRLTFVREQDDLGSVDIAILDDDHVGHVVFQRYEESPTPGTDVLVDAGVNRDEAVAALKRRLGVNRADFTWIAAYRSYADSLAAAVEGREDRAGFRGRGW